MILRTFAFCIALVVSVNTLKAQTIVSAGNPAPEIKFQQAIGPLPNPGFYKGKILVIDFWATWCAPCIAGFPEYSQLAESYKNNKDIVFAAMTQEPKPIVERFFARTQKKLNAIKLIDTSGQTPNSLNVDFIPYCVVIDKNNVIRWMGFSGELNKTIIDNIIAGKAAVETTAALATPAQVAVKPVNKPICERAVFTFSVAKSDSTKTSYEGGGMRFTIGSFYTFMTQNNMQLNDFLEIISGYSAATRITSDSTMRLQQQIDVYYKLGMDTAAYSGYKNKVLKDGADRNFILSLLAIALKFKPEVIKKNIRHYELVVQDPAKLHSFRSMQETHSSISDDSHPHFEIVGYNLKDISINLESTTKIIITDNIKDDDRYDLSLDVSNEATLDKSLQFHGLKLKEVTDDVEFLKLTFH